MSQDNSTAESLDVGFRLAEPTAVFEPVDAHRRVGEELIALAPVEWERIDAVFVMTVSDEFARIVVSLGEQVAMARPSASLVQLLRELRHISADSSEGPWWRMLVSVTSAGQVELEYDYGAEPFPSEHLFPAQAYAADLQVYPRKRLPVWLAAYIGHADRQTRAPGIAFAQAQSDSAAGVSADPVGDGLPPFPVLWARWAVISAAFVAAKSTWGPRITSGLGWFEGATRSGSTLYRLPHGRAVLSGGVWNAESLDAAYNDGAPLPELYRGAPDWVADPVLSQRATNGLMSFCYWWDGYAWYRGESPAPDTVQDATPGIWSSDSVFDVLTQALEGNVSSWVTALIAAAETGTVTRSALFRALVGTELDLDSAYYQLVLAGVAK